MRSLWAVGLVGFLGWVGCTGSHSRSSGSSLSSASGSAGTRGASGSTGATGASAATSSSSGSSVQVTDVAGNGYAGFADGPAGHFDASELSSPSGVAVDGSGNLYFADPGNNRIRKIDSSGNLTTVAGSAEAGFVDGPAAVAKFNNPTGVAVDGLGNLSVADSVNNRIRKIDPSGNVTTLAGNGVAGATDGLGGLNGAAEFDTPMGVAVDGSGNVYVADTRNSLVRKIDSNSLVTTFADLTNYPYYGLPKGVAVDGSGNVYVADSDANLILKVDPSGDPSTLAGSTYGFANGGAGVAEFDGPSGVAVDGSGNVYVADPYNQRIRKVDPSGNVTTLAGTGAAGFLDGTGGEDGGGVEFNGPEGVAVDGSGNLYVADQGNNRIRKVDSTDTVTTVAGNGTNGFADGSSSTPGTAELDRPMGVAVDVSGSVFFADFANSRIRKLDPSGNVSTVAGGTPGFADGLGPAAEFAYPEGVAVDASDTLYVADTFSNRIRRIDPSGNVTTLAGNGTPGFVDGAGGADGGAEFDTPTGVAVDAMGNVYVADQGNHAVRRVDAQGQVTTLAGTGQAGFVNGPGGAAGAAQFNAPSGVAIDGSGNTLVADTGNQCIRRIDAHGSVTTLAGGATFYSNILQGYADSSVGDGGSVEFSLPYGVAVDSMGNVYVADSDNNRIRQISPTGIVTTLAGNGASGFADGAGGANGEASFASPDGIAVDGSGNLWVSDSGNNCLRKIAAQ